jgi:hypothetical protein
VGVVVEVITIPAAVGRVALEQAQQQYLLTLTTQLLWAAVVTEEL